MLIQRSEPSGQPAELRQRQETEHQEDSPKQQREGEKKEDEPILLRHEELVVVTASKVEQPLINAPATMTVVDSHTIQNSPAQNYADLLRAVPGLNVAQTSARDINLTSRNATSTLSTSQLALLDGRSIYQDFFGFVLWDFLPVTFDELKRIEVIRGPASAVWGANALTGVVNIITKSPREMQGTTFTVGAGGFDRSVNGSDAGAGSLFYLNGTHARAANDRWAYKISAGAYTQDPLPRPTGTIPNEFHTPYPPFQNLGTTQPKLDVRVDYDSTDGRQKVIMAGGVAGTEGIIHAGTGPWDINQGSALAYGKVDYNRDAMKLKFFFNWLDGDAANLLTRDSIGNPLIFLFKNQTYDMEFGDIRVIGTKHALSYGGTLRHNRFDLSVAPLGNTRNEGGVYIQDEIFLSNHFRWVVGGRLDKFDVLEDPVFSPRTTFMVKPAPEHTMRFSFTRGYRAPSLVNNFLEIETLSEIDLGLIVPELSGVSYVFPVLSTGNEELVEESLTAYEVGYTGIVANKATLSAAFYINDTADEIFFTQVASYTAANPPPAWPLPPTVLDLLIASNAFGPGLGLPSEFSYRNLGKVRNKGVELGVDASVNRYVNYFTNLSWQAEPEPRGVALSELNIPPRWRFNAGLGFDYRRYFGSLAVSYTDDAFWQDVLDARYHGPTKAYTLINAGFGVRWGGERLTTSVRVTNLGNRSVQQHVFGDIIKRQVIGEMRVRF